jgi:hypothetical protein
MKLTARQRTCQLVLPAATERGQEAISNPEERQESGDAGQPQDSVFSHPPPPDRKPAADRLPTMIRDSEFP